MPLETGEFISDLVPSNPLGTDPKSEGDDHLRLVKKTVQQSFPNIDAQVDATALELNDMLAEFLAPTPEQAEKVVQHLSFRDSAVAGGAAAIIPGDNTVPQISEGTEYLPFSQSITPQAIGNRIRLRIKLNVGSNTNTLTCLALFIDGDNDAVMVDIAPGGGANALPSVLIMTHDFPALALDPIDIMLRYGTNSASQLWVNANGVGGSNYLGSLFSDMTITEVEPLP